MPYILTINLAANIYCADEGLTFSTIHDAKNPSVAVRIFKGQFCLSNKIKQREKKKKRATFYFTGIWLVMRIENLLQAELSGLSLMFYLHSDPNHFSCALDILKKGPTTLVSALYCKLTSKEFVKC